MMRTPSLPKAYIPVSYAYADEEYMMFAGLWSLVLVQMLQDPRKTRAIYDEGIRGESRDNHRLTFAAPYGQQASTENGELPSMRSEIVSSSAVGSGLNACR